MKLTRQRRAALLAHAQTSLAKWNATPVNYRAEGTPYNLINCEDLITLLTPRNKNKSCQQNS